MAPSNQDLLLSGTYSYRPAEIEEKWYKIWEQEGYFRPEWPQPRVSPSLRLSDDEWLNVQGLRGSLEDADGERLSVASSVETMEVSGDQACQLTASDTMSSDVVRVDEKDTRSSPLSSGLTTCESSHLQIITPPQSSSRSLQNLNEGCRKTFTIFTPPPNVTGDLHCGHALAIAIQDALTRYHRMRGFRALFIPGCDHAGIAAQVIVEKKLVREQDRTRHQIGRYRFVRLLNEWTAEYRTKIAHTLRRLGASVDWDREAFTMDDTRNKAVTEAFVRLHRDGVIYRANRIVNWCPTLRSPISEFEIETLEVEGRTMLEVPGYEEEVEFGVMYFYKYNVIRDDSTVTWITMATTRPELLLADTGIAVHPDDERFAHLIGLNARHAYSRRLLPIVGDLSVDRKWGTGAVSVAPGHSEEDFKVGRRNHLEAVVVFRGDGTVNEKGELLKGAKRFDARKQVVKNLEERDLLIKREPCKDKIQICNRTGDVVEPMMKAQWWMKMDSLTEDAIEVVKEGRIKMEPESIKGEYFEWAEEPKAWCVSRQLWWGHKIPAWFLTLEEEERLGSRTLPDTSDTRRWFVAETEEEAMELAKEVFTKKPFRLTRDEEVLDSWFAAAIWPLAVLGWPGSTDFKEFYPATIVDTGRDVLFSWITKMILVNLKLTNEVPFREVHFHPFISDRDGKKMSKSVGNVIDPVDIITGCTLEGLTDKVLTGNLASTSEDFERIERLQAANFPNGIPECGADALRFALMNYTAGFQNILLDVNVVARCREFCEKIGDAVEYALMQLPPYFQPMRHGPADSLADRYIRHRLNVACREVAEAMQAREFSRATKAIHNLWCDDIRDLYPFMPFISEELWQRIPHYGSNEVPSIMVAVYPVYVPEYEDQAAEEEYRLVIKCFEGIRKILEAYIEETSCKVYIKSGSQQFYDALLKNIIVLQDLVGETAIELVPLGDELTASCASRVISQDLSIHLSFEVATPTAPREISDVLSKLRAAERAVVKQENKLTEDLLHGNLHDENDRRAEEGKLENYRAKVKGYEKTLDKLSKLTIG